MSPPIGHLAAGALAAPQLPHSVPVPPPFQALRRGYTSPRPSG
eukprot:CAMPEP_0113525186 /NCGR_PEP_ID=MMETSP0015_2-20120614/16_1 /TAXON_ID=2838 /ORGANISM="Odontella" /LENGTH=42 /DNA_ID=CAMNT_0000423313 /DNA_START=716 /DNA_END=840 /DNA_ORIENTATION=- /assembly_acc=CAM_ASM_000160